MTDPVIARLAAANPDAAPSPVSASPLRFATRRRALVAAVVTQEGEEHRGDGDRSRDGEHDESLPLQAEIVPAWCAGVAA